MIWSFVPISTIGTIISNLLYLLPSAYRHLNPSCLLNFLKFFLHIYIYVWLFVFNEHCTKNEVFIKDFFIKCDQIGKIHNAKLHCLRSGDTSTFDINAHVLPLVSLYTPWKHQKTFGFLMFSGDIGKGQWLQIHFFSCLFSGLWNYFVVAIVLGIVQLQDCIHSFPTALCQCPITVSYLKIYELVNQRCLRLAFYHFYFVSWWEDNLSQNKNQMEMWTLQS